jgi:hypothetical protein
LPSARRDEDVPFIERILLTADTRGQKWQKWFGAPASGVANRQAIKLDGFEVPQTVDCDRSLFQITPGDRLAESRSRCG